MKMTFSPIELEIDGVKFRVSFNKVLWSPESAGATFIEAPDDYCEVAIALAFNEYEIDDDGNLWIGESQLFEQMIDTHDDEGNEVPEGRESHVYFPVKIKFENPNNYLPMARPIRAISGTYQGQKIIAILEREDMLKQVVTTREAEELFGLASGSAKKAAQRGQIVARKSGGTWLMPYRAAYLKWNK